MFHSLPCIEEGRGGGVVVGVGGRNKSINNMGVNLFIILIFVKMNAMTIDHYRDIGSNYLSKSPTK